MQHHLENNKLAVSFREQGAELCSMRSKQHNTEYIWEGSPQIWGRHAPVLFPIVGKLKDNSYSHNGKHYQMGQHGFARDQYWQVTKKENDKITFSLQPSPELKAQYPFNWLLQITYILQGATLITRYIVKNPDSQTLYFSIGGHPAFRCPLNSSLNFSDYYLEFNYPEIANRHKLSNGLRLKQTQAVLKNERQLALTQELFNEDALVFADLKSNSIQLKSDKDDRGLTFTFEGFPYLGIWSKAGGAPFVCIEPWYGVADSIESTGNIEEKEGIQTLRPNTEFSCEYSISIF